MKAYRPSQHCDAEVSQKVQARRASKDRVRKSSGRVFDRKCCTNAKLTDDQIRWVRDHWDNNIGGGMTMAAMSRKLNISVSAISQICHGHAWKEVK